MSRLADVYARISPYLAHRPGSSLPTRAHAAILRRSRGRIGRRALGADVLVLRTIGRRSGKERFSPMFYARDGDAFVVGASNAASPRPPAWWLNLEAKPDSDVLVDGRWIPVRARAATAEERAELWPALTRAYSGYEHYRAIATREIPVVILERR